LDEQETWRPIWRKLEFASVTAIALTLLFVIVGESVEQVAATAVDEVAQAPRGAPKFNAIDYGATGSTKIVIGPCDTRKP
jgi:hypothetical protein